MTGRMWLVAGFLVLTACTAARPTPSPEAAAPQALATQSGAAPSPDASSTIVPKPPDAPSPTTALPDVPDDIRDAIAWRESIGLQSDPAWVIAVHADPMAVHHWEWPILPEEEAFLWDRQFSLDPFVPPIQAYARQHRDVFGGLFIDNRNSRIMTLWTEDPDGHLAAIRQDVGSDAPIAASLVRWSEQTLRDVQRAISGNERLFRRFDADVQGYGADISDNLVDIEISSADPDAPRLIAEALARELDVPVEMLRVTSDGTGLAMLPWGEVRGFVTWADGSPAGGELELRWEAHGVGACGGGDIGYGVGRGGEFRIPCRVGRYTFEVQAPNGDAPSVTVGVGDVTVREDRTSRLHIQLVPGARRLIER